MAIWLGLHQSPYHHDVSSPAQSNQIRLRMLCEASGKGHLPALAFAFASICSSRPSTASELT
jgi:hypothetical protein